MRPSSREVLTLLLIAIAAGNPTLAAPNYNRSDLALSSAALEARDAAPGFLSDLLGSLGIGRPKSSSPPSPPSHSSPWSPWSPWSPPSHSSPPAPPGPPVGKTIPTHQQNGQSLWGTNRLLPLPAFKSGSGTTLSAGWPWGTRNTRNTNPYTGQPNTGVTRTYSLTLSRCAVNPDGILAVGDRICVNGGFPGPLIEANYGDMLSVTVTNNLTGEGTSMHWHGFLQTGTNSEDGVPGVTQCPIPPGQSYTYNFRATLYGTSWYHTHYSAQYAEGAVGPIVIYGPHEGGYDIDIGPVMLMDWFNTNYTHNEGFFFRNMNTGFAAKWPASRSNLINGKMRFPCNGGSYYVRDYGCSLADYATFNFTSGKNHRLRLINSGVAAVQKFAIDGHVMQVIATDFVPVTPYNTSMVVLGVGQRADVIVYGSGKPTDAVWMRSNDNVCSLNADMEGVEEALAAVYYEKADQSKLPSAPFNSGPAAGTDPTQCSNDPLTQTVPAYPLAVDPHPVTVTYNITLGYNSTGTRVMTMGNVSFKADYNDPVLSDLLTIPSLLKTNPVRNVFNALTASSVRAILYNYDRSPHPIHLHGHNFQILAVGIGNKWDGTVTRPSNPTRRDVFIMPPAVLASDRSTMPSYLVLQWAQDNPGVWPLHCHFAWHSSAGLVALIVERPLDIFAKQLSFLPAIRNTCTKWNTWLQGFGQLTTSFDSGVKRRNELGAPEDFWKREVFPMSGVPSNGSNTGTATEDLLALAESHELGHQLGKGTGAMDSGQGSAPTLVTARRVATASSSRAPYPTNSDGIEVWGVPNQ